ncbi:hypothetical protein B0T24DRAFT_356814 [Lasiosphaeria ovina]|uniref:Uncharacterized protein n=1 Tax=Lasiosphaeria ovina TaxID=92902 RepID=A0AAE0K349_9PEZI|nr:hypothetical protein B0T24DRAFT_356814 [Lasiosphaeria ovina]
MWEGGVQYHTRSDRQTTGSKGNGWPSSVIGSFFSSPPPSFSARDAQSVTAVAVRCTLHLAASLNADFWLRPTSSLGKSGAFGTERQVSGNQGASGTDSKVIKFNRTRPVGRSSCYVCASMPMASAPRQNLRGKPEQSSWASARYCRTSPAILRGKECGSQVSHPGPSSGRLGFTPNCLLVKLSPTPIPTPSFMILLDPDTPIHLRSSDGDTFDTVATH